MVKRMWMWYAPWLGTLLMATSVWGVAVPCASNGTALQSIVHSVNASPAVVAAATELRDLLGQITGATFAFNTGNGSVGIAVGVASDFPTLGFESVLAVNQPIEGDREKYILRSHANGLYVIGATDVAVENAVAALLHHIGYRLYFPGDDWEIIPNQPTLSIDVDVVEKPDYTSRDLFIAWGVYANEPDWGILHAPLVEWKRRNRFHTQGFELHTGHTYTPIIHSDPNAFLTHPNWCAYYNGQRVSPGQYDAQGIFQATGDIKFDSRSSDLRTFVRGWALNWLNQRVATGQLVDSISMEPSDGGRWSNDDATDTPSNQAIRLANDVAAGIASTYPHTHVALYAYNEHSPPPTLAVDPKVIVSVATGFIKGGYTVEQLLDQWVHQGAVHLGIRDYYAITSADRDLPRKALPTDPIALVNDIRSRHAKSAKLLVAEAGYSWGPNGLGHYLAARTLWETDEQQHAEAHIHTFLEDCFGAAKDKMRAFYDLINGIDGSSPLPLSDHLVGSMYRRLDEALALVTDPKVIARIEALALYTRYVELYKRYGNASSTRQADFQTLIQFAYRIRATGLVHAKALYRDLVERDTSVSIPVGARWDDPESGGNPWKNSTPYTSAEVRAMIASGIANNAIATFPFASFGSDLRRADALPIVNRDTAEGGEVGSYLRYRQTFHTFIPQANSAVAVDVKAGVVYQNLGDVRIELWYDGGVLGPQKVASATVPPDQVARTVSLSSPHMGVHRIVVDDNGGGGYEVDWSDGQPMAMEVSASQTFAYQTRYALYFYVPHGTTTLGMYLDAWTGSKILDGSGTLAYEVTSPVQDFVSLSVPPGEDGKLWKLEGFGGTCQLLTVPPYLARSVEELLLPSEVFDELLRVTHERPHIPNEVLATNGQLGVYRRHQRTYYVLAKTANEVLTFSVTGGQIYNTQQVGPIDMTFWQVGQSGFASKLIAQTTVLQDQSTYSVSFTAPLPGLYRVTLDDHSGGSTMNWPVGMPVVIYSTQANPARFQTRYDLYFYVPRYTQTVSMYVEGAHGYVLDGDGQQLHDFGADYTGQVNLAVPAGQDGRLWRFYYSAGTRALLNIPSILAKRYDEMLFLKEHLDPLPSLMPVSALTLSGGGGDFSTLQRYRQTYYTYFNAPGTLVLLLHSGVIYQPTGQMSVKLYRPDGKGGALLVDQAFVNTDNAVHNVTLASTHDRLHWIEIDDLVGGNYVGYNVTWPAGYPVSVATTQTLQGRTFYNRYNLYFYVPKGTTTVSMNVDGWTGSQIQDGSGNAVYPFNSPYQGPMSLTVPAGQDGRLWKLHHFGGTCELLNVPLYLAPSKDQLLLPHAVIEQDR